MASFYGKEFDNTARRLIKALNFDCQIKIKTLSQKDIDKLSKKHFNCEHGSYALFWPYLDKKENIKKVIIYIARGYSLAFAELQLVHELSHLLDPGGEKVDHGNSWGVAYSKVYRFYIGEKEEI